MNILVLGSGGREHAFAWKISQSKHCSKLFVAPGNAGTAQIAENVNVSPEDFEGVKKFVLENDIKLVVVGPEAPLVAGICDFFTTDTELKNIPIIGPKKAGALLEGSKDFSKAFMLRHNIPTAAAKTFTKDQLSDALAYIDRMSAPVVLKADGLAAGKGVLICESIQEAKDAIQDMLVNEKFGEASSKVLVEQFLKGIELSVFVLTDGIRYKILPEAKDYKRIGEQDTGLNTGGMGAISPVSFADTAFMNKVKEKVVKPSIRGLAEENIPFLGFLFIGLMKVGDEPYVIEYNVRMGDPETQAVIPRIKNDLVELFLAAANGKLDEIKLEFEEKAAATIVMVAGGYPEDYKKGAAINGLEDKIEGTYIFHAGTKQSTKEVLTNGGRVLAVTGMDADLAVALEKAYKQVAKIKWEDNYYRKDIGKDVLSLT